MEKYLTELSKLTSSPRFSSLNSDIQLALDTLATQKVSFAFKAWQIRQKCLSVLKLALESNNQLMTISALSGIEYVVNYPEFEGYTGEESLDKMDAKLLVVQVLDSMGYLPQLRDNEKLHGLKILLSLCCKYTTSFSGELIIKIVQICSSCCQGGKVNRETQASAEALSTQAVARLANADISNDVTNDVIGLVKFFVQQLDLSVCNSSRALYLECMLVVLQILDSTFVKDSPLFLSLVHKKLCQTLVALLDIAIKDKSDTSVSKYDSQKQFNLYKKIFFISTELIRLIGSNEVTGPAMDSLFHALFLWPVDHHKITIIKFLAKYLSNPKSLLQFLGFQTYKQDDFRYNLLKQLLDDVSDTMQKCNNTPLHLECNFAAVQFVTAISDGLKSFHEACPLNAPKVNKEAVEVKKTISSCVSDSDLSVYMSPIHSSKQLQTLEDQMKSQYFSLEDVHSPSPCYLSAAEGSDFSETEEYLPECDLSIPTSDVVVVNGGNNDLSDDTSICTEDSSYDEDSDGDISKYLTESLTAYNSSNPSIQHINCQQQQISHALAQHFIEKLTQNLSRILQIESEKEVDDALLSIAQEFCQETYDNVLSKHNDLRYIVQGESIYLLLYSSLLLNLKLMKNQHYNIHNLLTDDSEKTQWVKSQQAQGIYLSEDFLDTVFYHISKLNILKIAGFDSEATNFENYELLSCSDLPVLAQLLIDIDGLGFQSVGSQLSLNSSTLFCKVSGFCNYDSCEDDAICKDLPVSVLKMLWGRFYKILTHVLKTSKTKVRKQKFIRLPKIFNSPNKNITEMELDCSESAANLLIDLLKLSCWFSQYNLCRVLLVDISKWCNQNVSVTQNIRPFVVKLMDSVISYSIEISSHAPDCWQYFFQMSEMISSYYYKICNIDEHVPDFQSNDVNCVVNSSAIKQNSIEKEGVKLNYFNAQHSTKCIQFLYSKLSSLYDVIPRCLNCQSLVRFLQAIRKASYLQLFIQPSTSLKIHVKASLIFLSEYNNMESFLFFKKIEDCTVKCVQNNNHSFLTVFHCWNAVAPHFVEASCHSNISIARKSVEFLHNILRYFLTNFDECNFFYTSEAFFRPLERAMQLEGCDYEIQDQLIEVISDLVAAYPTKIKSGWRCLFNALRYAGVDNISSSQYFSYSPVFDVFKVFTSVCDAPIIATALNDSIKCMFKLLIGYGENECPDNLSEGTKDQFVLYLTKISGLLEKVYNSKAAVNFSGCHSIDVIPTANDEGVIFNTLTSPQWENHTEPQSLTFETPVMFLKCDVLCIWFSFLEQTSHAALACPPKYQASITNLLTNFIEDLWFKPGPEFAFHTIFYVCLPLLYTWLQRIITAVNTVTVFNTEDTAKQQLLTYKHVFGSILQITSKMIADFLKENKNRIENEEFTQLLTQVKLVWKASINLCLFCLKTNHHAISKLGCSCLNHLFGLTKAVLLPEMIDDVCNVIIYSINHCLNPLKLLMVCFPITLDKCEKPLTHIDVELHFAKMHEKHLTVNMDTFMLSFQDDFVIGERSHIMIKECLLFVNTKEACDENIIIPLTSLGIHTSSLMLLINCVESLLLDNIVDEDSDDVDENKNFIMENIVKKFTLSQVMRMLNCIGNISSHISSFERRFSLKFLLQRLANLHNPANLHRIQIKSFSLYIEILFKLGCYQLHSSPPQKIILKNTGAVLPFVDLVDMFDSLISSPDATFQKMPNGDSIEEANERDEEIESADKKMDVSDFLSVLHDSIMMLAQEYRGSIYADEDFKFKYREELEVEQEVKLPENEEHITDAEVPHPPPDNLMISGSDVLDLNWTHDYMAYVRKPSQVKNAKKIPKVEKGNKLFSKLTISETEAYVKHLLTIYKANQLSSQHGRTLTDFQSNAVLWNKMLNMVLTLALQLDAKQSKVIYPFLYGPLLHVCTEIDEKFTKNLMEEWLRKVGLLFSLIPSRHIF